MKKHIPEISAHTHTPDLSPSDKHDLECDLCGHTWSAAPASVTYRARKAGRTVGCPICNRSEFKEKLTENHHRKSSSTAVDDDLARIGFKLLEPYTNAKAKLLMQCVCCGSKWDNSTVLSRKQTAKKYNSVGCFNCSDNQRQAFKDQNIQTSIDLDRLDLSKVGDKADQKKRQLVETLSDYNSQLADISVQITGNFTSPYEPADFTCMDCGHEFTVIPNVKLISDTKHGCPKCSAALRIDETTKLREAWINELGGEVTGETFRMLQIEYKDHNFSVLKTVVRALTDLDQFLPSDEPSEKSLEIIARIENAKVTLIGGYQGYRIPHEATCGVCGHGSRADTKWITTPSIISQSLKINGNSSCPICAQHKRYGSIREINKERIHRRGYTILSENYRGTYSVYEKVRVRRESCGHEFELSSGNLLNGVECPVCNVDAKVARLAENARKIHEEWLETAPEWEAYHSEVTSLTRIAYNQYIDQINPNRHPRGKAGTPGAYQLDHIVSVRYCFDNLIPAELCGHVNNLQMLPWRENTVKSDKVDESNLPEHIKEYLVENEMR